MINVIVKTETYMEKNTGEGDVRERLYMEQHPPTSKRQRKMNKNCQWPIRQWGMRSLKSELYQQLGRAPYVGPKYRKESADPDPPPVVPADPQKGKMSKKWENTIRKRKSTLPIFKQDQEQKQMKVVSTQTTEPWPENHVNNQGDQETQRFNESKQRKEEELVPAPDSPVKVQPTRIEIINEPNLWENMTRNGPPRMILSITGSRTKFNQKQWSFESLHRAIFDTTRKCRECGILFNEERTPEIKLITKTTMQLLKPLQSWSYSKLLERMSVNNSTVLEQHGLAHNSLDRTQNVEETVTCADFIKLVEYESFINRRNIESTKDVLNRSPVVLLVVHGDLFTLEHVARAIQKDISVTVIKGTGGAADLLATCYDSLNNLPRKLPTILGMRMTEELYSKVERIMKIIHEKHWLINTFDLENDDEHLLWTRVTNGIIRAWSFENVKVSEVDLLDGIPVFDRKCVSVSKYVSAYDDASKNELFEGLKVDSQNSEDSYFQNLLFDALKEDRLDLLAALLAMNVKLKDAYLQRLYDQRIKENENENSEPLHVEVKTTKCTMFWEKVDKITFDMFKQEKNGATEYKKAAKAIINKLLKGSCMMCACFNIDQSGCCCMTCLKTSVEDSDNSSEKMKDGTTCDNSDLLLECMITGQYDRLGIVWSNCDYPMYTALIVSRIMRSLSEMAVEMAEDKWVDTFTEQEQLFSDRAISILEKISEEYEDPGITAMALTEVSNVWGMVDSPKHFSNSFLMEEFSSHSVAHKDANNILYSAEHINTFKDFIYHHTFKERSSKILTAPQTRITVHWVFYLAALVCYGIFLTTNVSMDTLSPFIIAVFVFVIGDFLEELVLLTRRVRRHCSIKMIVLHFMDIWRIMDLLFWILFLTGFLMHVSTFEDLYIHTRRVYSVALFLMFMRLLKMLFMCKSLGIMIIMTKEMLKDLLKFLVVASVFMFAAGIVYHANNYPNHTYSEFSFEYWRFWQLLKIPYWQIYGELYLDTLEGSDGADCTDNETIWSTDPTAERCSQNDWLAVFIAAVYMMLVNWLLLNIVIAMFSSQYARVLEKSEQKWRHHRNIVVIDHEHKIPSPLNLIIRPILILICRKGKNCCAGEKKSGCRTQTIDATSSRIKVTSSSNKNGSKPEDAFSKSFDKCWEASTEDNCPYLEITTVNTDEALNINTVQLQVVNVDRVVISYVTPEGTTEVTTPEGTTEVTIPPLIHDAMSTSQLVTVDINKIAKTVRVQITPLSGLVAKVSNLKIEACFHREISSKTMLEKQKEFARDRIKEESKEENPIEQQRELAKLQIEQTKLQMERLKKTKEFKAK